MNFWWTTVLLMVAFLGGVFMLYYAEATLLSGYDVHNCIENNANMNEYPQNPLMIEKIQNECWCLHQNNYTSINCEVNP